MPCRFSGRVIHGNHLGRTLGYPTANLELSNDHPFPLPTGVYAASVQSGNRLYPGMANVGFRPTIEGKSLTVEVHLFGFSGDLYDSILEVTFLHRIREEKKFETLELLVRQIRLDEKKIRKLLA